jgi:hypothetical protein
MNKGKLIKEGRNWKIQAPTFKQPMSIQGDFGLTDEMANQEVEFDNSKGPITKIRFNNKDFSRREIKNNERWSPGWIRKQYYLWINPNRESTCSI